MAITIIKSITYSTDLLHFFILLSFYNDYMYGLVVWSVLNFKDIVINWFYDWFCWLSAAGSSMEPMKCRFYLKNAGIKEPHCLVYSLAMLSLWK